MFVVRFLSRIVHFIRRFVEALPLVIHISSDRTRRTIAPFYLVSGDVRLVSYKCILHCTNPLYNMRGENGHGRAVCTTDCGRQCCVMQTIIVTIGKRKKARTADRMSDMACHFPASSCLRYTHSRRPTTGKGQRSNN